MVAPVLGVLGRSDLLTSAFNAAVSALKETFSRSPEGTNAPQHQPPADDPTGTSPEAGKLSDPTTQEPEPASQPIVSGQTPEAVRRGFAGPKSMQTWQNQMVKRGWTASQIEEALQNGQRFPADNRINPGNGATRYVHPKTGRSVVIDDTTGHVMQFGGNDFGHER